MLTPLGTRILLKKIEDVASTSLIYKPIEDKLKPSRGEVLAVNAGNWDHGVLVMPAVSVGDRVRFFQAQALEIAENGENYFLIEEKYICAKE